MSEPSDRFKKMLEVTFADPGDGIDHVFWLSFADPHRPTGTQFLGACMVMAPTFPLAVFKAHVLRINPGGEVRGTQLPPEPSFPHPSWLDVLFDRETIEEQDALGESAWKKPR